MNDGTKCMKIIINNNNSTSIKKKTESSSSSGLIIGIIIGGGVAFVALITTIIICVKKECCGICDKISLKKNEPTEQTYDMSTTENITLIIRLIVYFKQMKENK